MIQKSIHTIIIAALCAAFTADAGDWHQPSQLVCSTCHTIHYSEAGTSPARVPADDKPFGPFTQLLLASTVNGLCLSCHDGYYTEAPDVIDAAYPAAAGYFANSGGSDNENAHNLGMSSGETPPGSTDSLILSCTSCHNPHGSPGYRNLLLDPPGSVSSNITVEAYQVVKPDGPGGNKPDHVYIQENILYQDKMSQWCCDCHPDFQGTSVSGSRHPQEVLIYGADHTDDEHWESSISNRVPVEADHTDVQDPDDIPSTHDRVFCLSCHKAHGSAIRSSLIRADGNRMLSTCLQCHYGPYELTKHGDATDGVYRIADEPAGDCVHCHDEHASQGGGLNDYLLFTENNKNLCYTGDGEGACHAMAGTDKIYQGQAIYDVSTHEDSMPDNGRCLNCHTPHGQMAGSEPIPGLAIAQEEALCLTCHGGSSAKNIAFEIAKNFHHPISESGGHDQSENGDSSNYDAFNRHAECVDCHNPHYAKSDGSSAPSPPDASNRIKGVSGVSVIGEPYIPSDVGITYEYQLCYKCHSSWDQLVIQPDMAELFDPGNDSYHPVEAPGKNTNINLGAFTHDWGPTDMMYCTDCHSSDETSSIRGPHGSQYEHILKMYYDTSLSSRAMSLVELCFDCHNYDTYANESDLAEDARKDIRFGDHAEHVDGKNIPCYICHDSHGSSGKPHLILMDTYMEDPVQGEEGGACISPGGECHSEPPEGNEPAGYKYYRVQYDR